MSSRNRKKNSFNFKEKIKEVKSKLHKKEKKKKNNNNISNKDINNSKKNLNKNVEDTKEILNEEDIKEIEKEFINNNDNKEETIIDKEDDTIKKKKNLKLLSKKKKNSNSKSKKKNSEKKIDRTKKKKKNTSNRKSKPKKEKKKKNILRNLLIIFLTLCLLGVASITAFMIYIVATTEEFDPNKLKNKDQTIIYDKDGNEIAKLGNEKRESIKYEDLPQVLIDAIVATEDSRFYIHNGVDMARFLKASVLQVLGQRDAGGASTLTMQVVKNNLTNTTSSGIQGIIRKFKDVYISVFFVEKKYTKNEILEMYVNDSGLGGQIYGVEEASKYYFGKSVSDISLPEAALLAGMYQAPSRYNPYKNPEAASKRRNTVLSLMVRHGYITEDEKEMAANVPIHKMLANNNNESDYQGYIDTVIEEVKDKTGNDPAVVSMKIYTALDRNIQDGINNVLNGTSYKGWINNEIQAGIAITNVNDGTIVAIGAGRNRKPGDWNNATQTRRQPGSTAKPLFDYGPGFEYNNFSTYTLFNDEKWNYSDGPEIGNWDGRFEGLITLRRALSFSRNVPALKAFQQVSKKNIVKFVNGLGLDVAANSSSSNYKKYPNGGDNAINEAFALGGVPNGFTPLEMAEAYATFANGGYHINTHAVTKIEYRDTGEIVDFTEEKTKVMSDSTAYLMNNVLQYAVEHGFNGGARVYGSTVAAKTGTSNLDDATIKKHNLPYGAVNDLWTVAYTPDYSVALWYGYKKVDHNHYLNGASAPKDNVMRAIMQCIPKSTKKWNMPSSVVPVQVEKESWPPKLPSKYTPNDMKVTEYFKRGTQPTEVSERYNKFEAITNLQKTKAPLGYKLTWNWKKPNVLDSEYLSKQFNNSIYGKESAKYLKQRLDYNAEELGHEGFGIYKKDKDGNLTLLSFVKDNEYVYVPETNKEITLVIIAEYEKFKDNRSNEVEIKIKNDGLFPINADLKLELNGNDNTTINKGTYTDLGIKVLYDDDNVTNLSIVTYKIDNKVYLTKKDLEEAINKLEPGEIEIKYIVTYKTKKESITRKVTIK